MILPITIAITLLSLVGVVLNIKKKRLCFGIWLITNSAWCVYDFCIGAFAQSALFAVYAGLAVWGLVEWRRKKDKNKNKVTWSRWGDMPKI